MHSQIVWPHIHCFLAVLQEKHYVTFFQDYAQHFWSKSLNQGPVNLEIMHVCLQDRQQRRLVSGE